MNLYILRRTDYVGYDASDSIVVAAPDEGSARAIRSQGEWTNDPESLQVELIGTATEGNPAGVIHESFNAG